MKFSNYVIFAAVLMIGACVAAPQNRGVPEEASARGVPAAGAIPSQLAPEEVSGIIIDRERVDDRPLVLVGDENPGTYFACEDGDTLQPTTTHAPLIEHFEITDCLEYKIRGATVATDFESVALTVPANIWCCRNR